MSTEKEGGKKEEKKKSLVDATPLRQLPPLLPHPPR